MFGGLPNNVKSLSLKVIEIGLHTEEWFNRLINQMITDIFLLISIAKMKRQECLPSLFSVWLSLLGEFEERDEQCSEINSFFQTAQQKQRELTEELCCRGGCRECGQVFGTSCWSVLSSRGAVSHEQLP